VLQEGLTQHAAVKLLLLQQQQQQSPEISDNRNQRSCRSRNSMCVLARLPVILLAGMGFKLKVATVCRASSPQ
jgi:hypothetical protein